jgi:hypothetical protein
MSSILGLLALVRTRGQIIASLVGEILRGDALGLPDQMDGESPFLAGGFTKLAETGRTAI